MKKWKVSSEKIISCLRFQILGFFLVLAYEERERKREKRAQVDGDQFPDHSSLCVSIQKFSLQDWLGPMTKSNVSRKKNFMVEVLGFRVSLLFCYLREREREFGDGDQLLDHALLCIRIQKCSLLGWSCSMKKWKASPNPVELVFLGYFIVMALRELTPAKCRLLRLRSELKHSLHYFFCNRIYSS